MQAPGLQPQAAARQVPGYTAAAPWGAEIGASRRRLQRQG
jgi:hypothetical protein